MSLVVPQSLRSCLSYEPKALRFGTSGRRGEVIHLTQLEIYINLLAEIQYLQSLPIDEGGVAAEDPFFLAYDLRLSSTGFDHRYGGRGEIFQAAALAAEHAGMQPVNLGAVPTPALIHYALSLGKGSAMITGSHIPFNYNGYKLNTSQGELLKRDEAPITAHVERVRQQMYAQRFEQSLFDENGMLKEGHRELPPADPSGERTYVERYENFFSGAPLTGARVLVYQHSAVSRDIIATIFSRLGAEVVTAGRSDIFIPIDTENLRQEQLASIQALASKALAEYGPLDGVISTDGDGDRPLLLGLTEGGEVRFFGGDLLGMVAAEFLQTDAVIVPISCNDAIDRGALARVLEPKTKIGSPFVIAGMERAIQKGRKRVCGWEANGGFLLGSSLHQGGLTLRALPTRDAVLPLICTLLAAKERRQSLMDVFAALPQRYGRSALVPAFSRSKAAAILSRFSPAEGGIHEVHYGNRTTIITDSGKRDVPNNIEIRDIRSRLQAFFSPHAGFTEVIRLNYVDGIRIWFSNGDVVHLRPSGNADEMRVYAVADTQERADEMASFGVEPEAGIIATMAASVYDRARQV
jgi:phosphomannomutase